MASRPPGAGATEEGTPPEDAAAQLAEAAAGPAPAPAAETEKPDGAGAAAAEVSDSEPLAEQTACNAAKEQLTDVAGVTIEGMPQAEFNSVYLPVGEHEGWVRFESAEGKHLYRLIDLDWRCGRSAIRLTPRRGMQMDMWKQRTACYPLGSTHGLVSTTAGSIYRGR